MCRGLLVLPKIEDRNKFEVHRPNHTDRRAIKYLWQALPNKNLGLGLPNGLAHIVQLGDDVRSPSSQSCNL